ncbi:MAG: DUF6502 family protein, partial [Lautropia sp.]
PEAAIAWFAELLEPLAVLALRRGVRLPALIDAMKLALVSAAIGLDGTPGSRQAPPRSDSRLAVMTGVHRKDLRRIRDTGATVRAKRRSLAGEVFARWQSDPRYLTRRGGPRALARQSDGSDRPSFEALVASVTRDVHPRAILDELLRLRMVEPASGNRLRLVRSAFVPAGDAAEMLAFARDNLADHCGAIAANLDGDGHRFLEQALYSDELTEQSALQFNRETRAAWDRVFATMMPRLQALYEADRNSDRPRDRRVRLGMYGFVATKREQG